MQWGTWGWQEGIRRLESEWWARALETGGEWQLFQEQRKPVEGSSRGVTGRDLYLKFILPAALR